MSSKQLDSIINRTIPATQKPVLVQQASAKPAPVPVAVEQPANDPAPVAEAAKAVPKTAKAAAAKKEAQKSIQAFVPASVARSLTIRAAQEGVTVRTIILQGLKEIGLAIPESELRDRRK